MKSQSGQALTVLLFFISVSIIITTGAVALIIGSSMGASRLQQSITAYDIAEAGIENATLRLLRDPTYSGETLTVGGGTATISVTGDNPQTITARGHFNNYVRQVQAVISYSDGVLSVLSWGETL